MGAWGTGIFEDDTALDLLADAIETDAESFIKNASSHVQAEYLEYDQCHEIIISAVVLDTILNKATYRNSDEEFQEWVSNQEMQSLVALKENIIQGLKLVTSDKSELNELWQESEEEYLSWKTSVEVLATRLI